MLSILNINSVGAQTTEHGAKPSNTLNKISVNDIVGDWYTGESSSSKISFTKINDAFVGIDGIKHGSGNYLFQLTGDSISVNGMAMNWPPYDCKINLLNSDQLEITFYQFYHKESTKLIYRRRLNK